MSKSRLLYICYKHNSVILDKIYVAIFSAFWYNTDDDKKYVYKQFSA